ncbi:MAG: DUF1640 domain-containing protein [Methylococcaceae bacterium]
MITTITFDTQELVNELEISGFTRQQSEKVVSVLKKSQGELVTKTDLRESELRLDSRFERIDGELKLNRWMLGAILASVLSIVVKSFV